MNLYSEVETCRLICAEVIPGMPKESVFAGCGFRLHVRVAVGLA
jgi:hypothetical protein